MKVVPYALAVESLQYAQVCTRPDLAFKASQENKGKARVEHKSSSDDDIDDASLALMVRRTIKMLKKLNKNGVKFDGKKFERIKMPKRGVNWANSKFSCNN